MKIREPQNTTITFCEISNEKRKRNLLTHTAGVTLSVTSSLFCSLTCWHTNTHILWHNRTNTETLSLSLSLALGLSLSHTHTYIHTHSCALAHELKSRAGPGGRNYSGRSALWQRSGREGREEWKGKEGEGRGEEEDAKTGGKRRGKKGMEKRRGERRKGPLIRNALIWHREAIEPPVVHCMSACVSVLCLPSPPPWPVCASLLTLCVMDVGMHVSVSLWGYVSTCVSIQVCVCVCVPLSCCWMASFSFSLTSHVALKQVIRDVFCPSSPMRWKLKGKTCWTAI